MIKLTKTKNYCIIRLRRSKMKKLLIALSLLTAITLGAIVGCKSDKYPVGSSLCVIASGQEFNLDILAQFTHKNAKVYVVLVKQLDGLDLVTEEVLAKYETPCSK